MAEAIKSLIFFDLETTGLSKPTKITELCFVACSVDHFITSSRQEVPEIPRVLHKLSFCVNPSECISEISTRITGLDNYKLEHESHLGVRELEMITKFVERLQQPTCLVAHNGNSFDYPLLLKEFREHNVAIPGNLFCVDSLKIFRKIDKDREQVELKQTPNKAPEGKKKYRLCDIYRRFYGTDPEDTHRAESDCYVLLKCALMVAQEFLANAQATAKLFVADTSRG